MRCSHIVPRCTLHTRPLVEGFARIRFGSPSIRRFLLVLGRSVCSWRSCTDPLLPTGPSLDPLLSRGLARIRCSKGGLDVSVSYI